MSRRVLKPLAEARRYHPFAYAGPWWHWDTGERFWSVCATKTQAVTAHGQRKQRALPPVWTHALRMERVLAANIRRSNRY